MSFFDSKTRQRWISRPASSYVTRLLGFIRAMVLRLGRKPSQHIVKGGVRSIQTSMVCLLAHTEFKHLRWHAWRRLGATLFIRHGPTMQELMSWARWRSVAVAMRYVAAWDDSPWDDVTLPRATLLSGPGGGGGFEHGTRPSRASWPAAVLSRRDTWESDGLDEPNPDPELVNGPDAVPVPSPPQQLKRARPVSLTAPGSGTSQSESSGVPKRSTDVARVAASPATPQRNFKKPEVAVRVG